MAESSLERALKTVAIACAASTTFVKIVNMNPFEVAPQNLSLLTFRSVGIVTSAQMEAFRATLIQLLPETLVSDLEKMELSPDLVIRLVANHVEALLLSQSS
jgi:hypothetical protein